MISSTSAEDLFRMERTVSDCSEYARVTRTGSVADNNTYTVEDGGVTSPIGASQWQQYTYVFFFLHGVG